MKVAFKKVALKTEKINEISSSLTGYLQNDVWDTNNSFFDDIRPQNWNIEKKKIDFSLFPVALRKEIKFYFARRLEERSLRLWTAVNYSGCFYCLAEHLNHTYPFATSFINIPLEKAMINLRSNMVTQGLVVDKDGKLSTKTYERVLRQLCSFFENFYDDRDEFEKNIWDVRHIPGAKYNKSQSAFRLNFTEIPKPFRNIVKRYLKMRIGIYSQNQCSTDIRAVELFLNYISKLYPNWTSVRDLSRGDMESYLVWFRQYTAGTKRIRNKYLICLRSFLEFIQRAGYKEAPTTPFILLLWKEDIPQRDTKTEFSIKYIPEGVLRQLEDNIECLQPEYIPVVILLRASGWRISDIFNLRYDNCLERTVQGWWLCGDIPKTQVLNHRVPITDEVGAIVQAVVENVKEKSTPENNPQRYLFVRFDGKRKGLPPSSLSIRNALNRFSNKYSIVDDQGNIYNFGNHAFRHTKGVELINNGMNILHVQKWMAHASPEMTLSYAKILDNTMRKSWEEAMKNGAFRLDDNGKPIKVDATSMENEDVIEWEYIRHNLDAVRMPLGYCLKPKKIDCKHQLNPCLNCRNLCTTPDFIPQYELEIREVRLLIQHGKAQNQTLWVDKNQHLLERYEAILILLKEGKAHHLAGKKGREYVGEERHNVKPSA